MRGIIAVSVLLGFAVVVIVVSWLSLIYVDVNHDWAKRSAEFPKRATRRGLGRVIYRALWRRRVRRQAQMDADLRDSAIEWGHDQV